MLRLLLTSILLLYPSTILAEDWVNEVAKSAGESIVIEWDYPTTFDSRIREFSVYRQTGISQKPAKFAVAAKSARTYSTTMPGGSTHEYRFRIVAVANDGDIGPAGNEIVVVRK